ncbi:MAG TPA: type II secretion system protein GspC [Solimonas sp.]|nr:type II secretion system protein GspC [Solimonas sp.]
MPTALNSQQLLALYERHGRLLPPLATFLLLLLLANLVARLVWALLPEPEGARWQPAPAATAAPVQARGPDLNAIRAAQLFGSYQASVAGNPREAPETRLSLTLMGILAGDQNDSRALIASSNGEEKPYAIGDDVVPGVSLQAIFPDRVILSRSGQLETLRLDKDAPSQGGGPVAEAGPAPDTSGAAQSLASIRDQVLADPARASEFVRVQPSNVNGQLKGYRVYPGRERGPFADSGLRPGDLVTAVNGIQLDDNQKALQMLTDLSKANAVNLTVERGGQTQTINLTLN